MPAIRVFVVRVVRRRTAHEILGVVEQVTSRKRHTFRTADELWQAIAGPAKRRGRSGAHG